MDQRTRTVLGYVAVGIASALLAGAAAWALAGPETAPDDTQAERIAELESEVASLTAAYEAALGASEDPETPAEEPAPTPDPSPSAEDGRHFCFITHVATEGGEMMITVDYAEMLTGAEAAAAASAAGEESPPPNDYFIRNVNPKLRTFAVEPGISVRLTTTADGVNPDGYDVGLGQWHDFMIGMTSGMERLAEVPYWIEVENGVVTAIDEQYLP